MPHRYLVLDVIEVHDGDTFRLLLDLGFEQAAFPWLRLKDYSCPELGDDRGLMARQATIALMPFVTHVVTFKRAGLEDTAKSFARYLAEAWLGDRLLGDRLVDLGHAVKGARVG
jgi:endonuclease YncB( thermonuclease family)